MRYAFVSVLLAVVAVGLMAGGAEAFATWLGWKPRPQLQGFPLERGFSRVGTLANYHNAGLSETTVSEIVAATADGRTLVYTDSPGLAVGFIDIADPANPLPDGTVLLDPDPDDDVDYEPTSVDVLGNTHALVGVNTSASFTDTSGSLFVIDIASRAIVAEVPLGGQPDSVRISPDERYVAIAIENERNEDLCVGGTEDGTEADEDDCEDGGGALGVLPQTPYGNPPGFLAVVELAGPPAGWAAVPVDLTGLALYAPGDPEPEFVDVNSRNEAVVTLQENNHVVVVDLESLEIVRHFSAGAVSLHGVDATEDGVIALTEALASVPREPDAVAWVPGPGGQPNIATANEGDLFGGSRGFSIFRSHGSVFFDSGAALEEIAVRHGHYPESRSENKGTEPEAIAYARYGRDDYLFVGSERGSFVAVYRLGPAGRPRFEQLLPAPLRPEGLLPIPGRNLLVTAGEEDDPELGVRSTVMIYQLRDSPPAYPQIVSASRQGSPIPWSALSGMTAIPEQPDALLAVWDSYYGESHIFRLDVAGTPAVITDAIAISGGTGDFDAEGIAIAPDDTLWVASEGNASDSRPNRLLQLDAGGHVMQEIGLPADIIACRAASANRATLGSGFEGVAIVPPAGGAAYRLAVVQQRGWDYTTPECEALDDDGGGFDAHGEPNWTRIWVYDPASGLWDHVSWELAPLPPDAAWVGLSEITLTPGGEYIVIERDNRTGDFAALKTLVRFEVPAADDLLISAMEKTVFDLLPHLRATGGWITDKPEGVAVTADGRTFVVTDNDGVEDWSGETWFLSLGPYWRLF